LERDLEIKAGQIAHLDKNNENNAEDNLVFLCFVHHDQFDSRHSQSKGLTKGEVAAFRSELYDAVGKALSVRVHFGVVTVPPDDPFAGHYTRIGTDEDSAEIEITPIPDSPDGTPRYAVTGFALWGKSRQFGPNIGDLCFVSELINEQISFEEPAISGHGNRAIVITFENGIIHVTEHNFFGSYGMNVQFGGTYQRS
jgi:hypothetical protein